MDTAHYSADVSTTAVDGEALLTRHVGLDLLVLLGSRARGDAHPGSDWDLGYIGDPTVDQLTLRADLVDALGTDAVDLVTLQHASAVLRRDAAVDGQVLAERDYGTFAAFQIAAATFWADVEPVVREAHADVARAVARG